MLEFSEFLKKNNFAIKSFDTNQLKAVGATTANVNWKARLYYSWHQESPTTYVVTLRSAAKWKPVSSIVVGLLTVGIGWVVGAATFTGHIVQAEKEFNQMWAEIERAIGANLGVVNQQGFGQYNPAVPPEYQQELQRQQQLQQQQQLGQQQAAGSTFMPAPGIQQSGQLPQTAQAAGGILPAQGFQQPVLPQTAQAAGGILPAQGIQQPVLPQSAQQVLPTQKMPMPGTNIGGEEVEEVTFFQQTVTK